MSTNNTSNNLQKTELTDDIVQKTADDCINRQDAIDALNRFSLGETDVVKLVFRMGDYLMRLPSAQPTPEPRWISCAEQLPDTDDMMLVTCAPKKGARNVNRAYYNDGAWHGSGTHAEVIAWMPLPLPYQEETT